MGACRFTWCFLVGPKRESEFHAVDGLRILVGLNPYNANWTLHRVYEVNIKNGGPDMLVRVRVGKIMNKHRFWNLLYSIPIDPYDRTYRNKTWIRDALQLLSHTEGIMSESSRLDWMEIHDLIIDLVAKKFNQDRFEYENINQPKPLFDLMEGRHIYN